MSTARQIEDDWFTEAMPHFTDDSILSCFSCDVELPLIDLNDLDEGYFCDKCLDGGEQ